MNGNDMFFGAMLLVLFIFLCCYIGKNRKDILKKDRELAYGKELFEIFANAGDAVFLLFWEKNDKAEYISPNAERILGTSEIDEIKGFVDFDIFAQVDKNSFVEKEKEYICKTTGETRWYRETIHRKEMSGRDGFIVVISDCTVEREGSAALKDAFEIARVANKARSQFLSNVSHDIRTPMNVIIGLCTLLKRDADNPEQVKNHAEKIALSGGQMMELVNDILDMGKIGSGEMDLNIGAFNLAELAEELKTAIYPQIKVRRQSFSMSASNIKEEYLLGDKQRISQVLSNLLVNAVKRAPENGEIGMEIRQSGDSSSKYVNIQFAVEDNGAGISEEYRKKIFEPFMGKSDNFISKNQETGMKMAITKNLVELMGGVIEVENKAGGGAVFQVELKLQSNKGKEDRDFWKEQGIVRMLVVHSDSKNNIEEAMAETGVQTESATGGGEAVRMAEEAQRAGEGYDVIVLAQEMWDMSGIETARRIRKKVFRPMVLLASAFGQEEAEEAGVDGLLPVPFFMTTFRKVIEETGHQKESDLSREAEDDILIGMKFLIVEDDWLNSEILSELLRMEGASCEVAENGKIAVSMFAGSEDGRYDAILMDVRMPEMDGYEATRAIRASSHPAAKTIPVIAMTADAFKEDIARAMDAGMNVHIAKPIDMRRFKDVIKKIF